MYEEEIINKVYVVGLELGNLITSDNSPLNEYQLDNITESLKELRIVQDYLSDKWKDEIQQQQQQRELWSSVNQYYDSLE